MAGSVLLHGVAAKPSCGAEPSQPRRELWASAAHRNCPLLLPDCQHHPLVQPQSYQVALGGICGGCAMEGHRLQPSAGTTRGTGRCHCGVRVAAVPPLRHASASWQLRGAAPTTAASGIVSPWSISSPRPAWMQANALFGRK